MHRIWFAGSLSGLPAALFDASLSTLEPPDGGSFFACFLQSSFARVLQMMSGAAKLNLAGH